MCQQSNGFGTRFVYAPTPSGSDPGSGWRHLTTGIDTQRGARWPFQSSRLVLGIPTGYHGHSMRTVELGTQV